MTPAPPTRADFTDTYLAWGNCIYVCQGKSNQVELMLTIHPTRSTRTPAEQAVELAKMMNDR